MSGKDLMLEIVKSNDQEKAARMIEEENVDVNKRYIVSLFLSCFLLTFVR